MTEIRNHIYTYMIDELDDAVFLYRQRSPGTSPSKVPTWAKLERRGLGFTQVCRVIRQEFLPLHRAKSWLSLWYEDIIEYTCLIFPVPAKAAGILEIRYPMDIRGQPLDIMPLVRLTLEATELEFTFNASCMWPEEDNHGCREECENLLEDFLDPHENRDGLARAADLFKEIVMRCDGEMAVSAQVYAAYAEPWMPQLHTREWGMGSRNKKMEAAGMLKSVGLHTMHAAYAYKVDVSAEGGEDYKTSWRRRREAHRTRHKF